MCMTHGNASVLALKRACSVTVGTDEDAILQLLTARSNTQRQEIKAVYKTLYGKVGLSVLLDSMFAHI